MIQDFGTLLPKPDNDLGIFLVLYRAWFELFNENEELVKARNPWKCLTSASLFFIFLNSIFSSYQLVSKC